jgi:hypothetical protein
MEEVNDSENIVPTDISLLLRWQIREVNVETEDRKNK